MSSSDRRDRGPLLRIGEAAALVGVSPSTLRFWEREGLVSPLRPHGRTRYYSPELIERLRLVHRLKSEEGLNASGVRRELERRSRNRKKKAQEPVQEPAHPGPRIRTLRNRARLTLRQLAELAGLSPSFLSSIEQGKGNPSLGALRRIAEALGTTTQELFGTRAGRRRVVRPADRVPLETRDPSMRLELLARGAEHLQPHLVTIPPGGGSGDSYTHAGEEFLFVLEGTIEVVLDEIEVHVLEQGDAITFPSDVAHRLANPGTTTARALWINTPPTF